MKRLLDMPASSPALEHAQRLLEAAPSVDDSTEQMLRIRRALDLPATATRGGAILRLPAFALGGALVVFGASAFAAVRVWVEHRAPHEAAEQRADDPADVPNARPLVAARAALPPSAAEPEVARPTAERAVVASAAGPAIQVSKRDSSRVSPRARVRSTHKATRVRRAKLKQARRAAAAARVASVAPEATAVLPLEPVPAPVAPPAPEQADSIAAAPVPASIQAEPERSGRLQVADFIDAADESDERDEGEETEVAVSEPEVSAAAKRSSGSELVVRAVRALRRDRDPEAAARLLERYRSHNPRGVLAEEVLSLQVEAALAAKDARAASYAREYMSRYPEGRYRARAQSALSGRVP